MKVQNELQFLKWISKAAREGRAWTIWSFLTWAPYHQASFSILLTLKSSKTLSESICVSDSSQPHLLFQVTIQFEYTKCSQSICTSLVSRCVQCTSPLVLITSFRFCSASVTGPALLPHPPSLCAHVTTTVNTVQNDGLRNGMIDLADKTRAVSLL